MMKNKTDISGDMEFIFRNQAENVDTLARFNAALSDQIELDTIYGSACAEFANLLDVDMAFLAIYDETKHGYQIVVTHSTEIVLPDQPRIFLPEQDLIGLGFRQSQPVIITRDDQFPYLRDFYTKSSTPPATYVLSMLFHEGNPIGLLGGFYLQDPGEFSPDEINLLQLLAQSAAAAVMNARLSNTAQKQGRWLDFMNEITQAALGGASVATILDLLAARFIESLAVQGCQVYLWDYAADSLVLQASAGHRGKLFTHFESSLNYVALCQSALQNGKATIYKDSSDHQPDSDLGDSLAVLVLPMFSAGQTVGAVLIEYYDPHPLISETDLPRWEQIIAQVTLAITNIRSIEQEKQRRTEAELLQQSIAAISSSLDVQVVLDRILTSLHRGVPYDSAAIVLIEDDNLRIAALGGSSRHTKRLGEKIGRWAGLFSLLANARAPVILADAQTHPFYEHWTQGEQVAIHGWMGVPLIAFENPVGYLALNGHVRNAFTEEHAHLAQAFANQAAIAIENARLFEQVRSGRERLQALSRQLVEVQEVERRFIAHELHDEIGQVLTGLQFILQMGKEGQPNEQLTALMEAQDVVKNLMSRVRELSLNLRPSMLDDLGLLPALKAHFERYQQQTGIQVNARLTNLTHRFQPEVENSTFRVVQEALTNAARYAWVSEIDVAVELGDGILTVRIDDFGQGFDTSILKDSKRSFGVAGMRERTSLAGGQFELTSAPGQGTHIRADFPTSQKIERRKRDRKGDPGG